MNLEFITFPAYSKFTPPPNTALLFSKMQSFIVPVFLKYTAPPQFGEEQLSKLEFIIVPLKPDQ